MVDEYERKYGPVDRTEFEGEFVVPPELRSRANSLNSRSLRKHYSLLGVSRSRTFLTLPVQHKNFNSKNIHNSVPDLSRTMPNTPTSTQKLSLANSYDSVLEENENEKNPNTTTEKENESNITYLFTDDGNQIRRNSEDLLSENTDSSPLFLLKQSHFRQNSEPTNRLIPVRAHLNKNPNKLNNGSNPTGLPPPAPLKPKTNKLSTTNSASTSSLLHGIPSSPDHQGVQLRSNMSSQVSPSKWGNVRGSNSFSASMNISAISTYSIPRVSLQPNTKMHLKDIPNKNLIENSGDSAA